MCIKYKYYNKNKFTQTITEYLMSNIIKSGVSVVERSQIDEIIKISEDGNYCGA